MAGIEVVNALGEAPVPRATVDLSQLTALSAGILSGRQRIEEMYVGPGNLFAVAAVARHSGSQFALALREVSSPVQGFSLETHYVGKAPTCAVARCAYYDYDGSNLLMRMAAGGEYADLRAIGPQVVGILLRLAGKNPLSDGGKWVSAAKLLGIFSSETGEVRHR